MKILAKVITSLSSRQRVIILAVIAVAVSAPDARSQQNRSEQDSIRLNATLVEVPAIVTDRTGKFVADLARGDFAIFEDGKRQEVALFTAVKQPFTAVLVLDTSNSAEDRLRAIQNLALEFAREARPDDRLMVISFDNEVRRLTDFTSSYAEIEEAVKSAESGFGKLFYEAVTTALEQLKDVEGRRAVILFTDGIDMRSIEATSESALRKAEEMGAVIYAVRFETRWWVESEARRQQKEQPESKVPFSVDGRIPLPPDFGGPDPAPAGFPPVRAPRIEIGTSRPSPPVTIIDGNNRRTIQTAPPDKITENLDKLYGEADAFLQTISSKTGGLVFRAETFDNTRSAFHAIAEELRNQYLIGYYPSNERNDGKYRKIKVEVARKDAQVRARPGYRPEASRQ
ncbi:MAG TPA: VWA domain-containing protein [Blastocatellia bacterium]|nr:VWA domain-containing protein [Blastocatellia bacterium]